MADNDSFAGLPEPAEAQALFTNPEFLQGAAMIAAKNRDPAMFKWLERAHVAAREGAFEAIGHLKNGNVQEAIGVWNRTGQFRDVVNVNQNQDGTYTVTRKGGATMTLDPAKEYKRFLSPRDAVEADRQEKLDAERAAERQLTRDQWERQFQNTKDWQNAQMSRYDKELASREAIAAGNAALTHARWAAGGGGGGSRSSGAGGGGGGGEAGDFDPKALDRIKEIRSSIEKRHEAMKDVQQADGAAPWKPLTDEELANRTRRALAAETAHIQQQRDANGKPLPRWVIVATDTSGVKERLYEFDSPEKARVGLDQWKNALKSPESSMHWINKAGVNKGRPLSMREIETEMEAPGMASAGAQARDQAVAAIAKRQEKGEVMHWQPPPGRAGRSLPAPGTVGAGPKTYAERRSMAEKANNENLAAAAAQGEVDRSEFHKDAASMRPVDLMKKWSNRRGNLSREQLIQLNKAIESI